MIELREVLERLLQRRDLPQSEAGELLVALTDAAVAPAMAGALLAALRAKGITMGRVLNHDNSPSQVSAEVTPDVFVRSVYFWDPDGVMLEFAAWTHGGFTEADVAHEAVDADGRKSRPVVLKGGAKVLEAAK